MVRGFWNWLFKKDRDGDRGFRNLLNFWVIFHISVGIFLSIYLKISLQDLTTKIAIPSSAILVGLSFAWAGRSASLFQDKAFSEFIIKDGAPVEGYIYSFQLSILTVLLFILLNFIIYSGGLPISFGKNEYNILMNPFLIYSMGSLALRECWGSILFVNKLTIQYYTVRKEEIFGKETTCGANAVINACTIVVVAPPNNPKSPI